MTEPTKDKHKQLAVRVASKATNEEKEALRVWIEKMLEIKASKLPTVSKSNKAIALTYKSKVILPTIKILAREIKHHGWDARSTKSRFGIIGVGVGVVSFGSQAAGIAALGGAIGVPLWVLTAAGATFVGVLYEEITGQPPPPKTTYDIIDADKDENSL